MYVKLIIKYFGPPELVWQSAGSVYNDCVLTLAKHIAKKKKKKYDCVYKMY